MLKKLAEKRNTLLIVFAVTFLILWALTLIFGNGEDKTFVLVLSLIFPFVIYGAYRLIFKIGGKNASSKILCFLAWIFLVVGTLGIIIMIIKFAIGFPNGLSPTFGGGLGLVIATLDEAKKL